LNGVARSRSPTQESRPDWPEVSSVARTPRSRIVLPHVEGGSRNPDLTNSRKSTRVSCTGTGWRRPTRRTAGAVERGRTIPITNSRKSTRLARSVQCRAQSSVVVRTLRRRTTRDETATGTARRRPTQRGVRLYRFGVVFGVLRLGTRPQLEPLGVVRLNEATYHVSGS
jgi:hypothetical protein